MLDPTASVPGVAAGQWLSKRNAAVSIVEEFVGALGTMTSESTVAAAVADVRARLEREQSGAADRAYLARSICRVATAVRRAGWAIAAASLLDWALEQQLADTFVFAEAIQCRLALGRWRDAERLIWTARRQHAISVAAYTSVMSMYARLGWASRCRRLFDRAELDGLATSECVAALIKAYSMAGCVKASSRVFGRAKRTGHDDLGCHIAMMAAYGRSGQPALAQKVFDEARLRHIEDHRLFTTMISVYCRNGMPDAAESVLALAIDAGHADRVTFEVLFGWYSRRREGPRAQRIAAWCHQAGIPSDGMTAPPAES
jgi:pentatricopeptide repeat protein